VLPAWLSGAPEVGRVRTCCAASGGAVGPVRSTARRPARRWTGGSSRFAMSRPLAACRAGRGGGCGACHQPLIVPGAWPGWQVWECGAGIGAAASVVDVLGEAGIGVAELVGSGSPGVRLSPADSEASPGPHRSPSRTGGPDTPANDQPRQTNTLDVQPLTPQLRGGSGLAGEQRVDPAAVAREHAAPPPQEPERPTVRCRRRPVRQSGIRPPCRDRT